MKTDDKMSRYLPLEVTVLQQQYFIYASSQGQSGIIDEVLGTDEEEIF